MPDASAAIPAFPVRSERPGNVPDWQLSVPDGTVIQSFSFDFNSTSPPHPIPNHPTPHLERVLREDKEVAEGVAGVAPSGDGGADEE